jgi:hypothetical protein
LLRKYTKYAVNVLAFLIGLGTAIFILSKGANYLVAGAISFLVVIALLLSFNSIADKLGFEKIHSSLWWPLWWGM